MLQSKRTHLLNRQKTLSFVIGFFVMACSMPMPQDRLETNADTATFFVHKADVDVTETAFDPKISLPIAKTFNFTICMKDSQHSQEIKNHDFEISGGEGKTITSDSNGCVIWSEKITYNHLAPAQWIEVARTAAARGFQQGQRIVLFALNPWENDAHSILEKKRDGLLKNRDATAALSAQTTQGIWIDDLRLTIEEKKVTENGTLLNLEIRTTPSFAVLKTGGQKALEPISKGEFEAEISLIQVYSENQKERRKVISKPFKVQAQISNNSLIVDAPITLSSGVRSGQIQLALKITPINGPATLGTFNGVFSIGEYDQIKGNSFSRLKNDFQKAQGQKTVEQYLAETQEPKADKKDPRESQGKTSGKINDDSSWGISESKSQVRIRELAILNVGFKGQKAMNREKVYSVKACMTGPIDSKAIRGRSFTVLKSNGTLERTRSNDEGCITFEDSVAFQYLDAECWLQRPVQITSPDLSLDEKLTIFVNPWADGPNSVRDGRQVGTQELTCAKGKSKIVLIRYDFERGEVDYPIDPFFNIKVKKMGIFKLQARLSRPSLTNTAGIEDLPAPPGKYLLRWAVVDSSVRDFTKAAGQIYQVQEKSVEIEAGGLVNESLSFESANLKALGNTNTLLLELAPENQKSPSSIATYRGLIVLANNLEGSNLEAIQEGSESLVQKLKTQLEADEKKLLAENQKMSQKEFFAKNENLQLMNLNQEDQTLAFRSSMADPLGWQPKSDPFLKATPPIATTELQNWLNTGKLSANLGKRLCRHWFFDRLLRPNPKLQNQSMMYSQLLARWNAYQCGRKISTDLSKYFDIQYRYFIQKAVKKKDLSAETKDLTFAHSFALSHSYDEATSSTLSADANIGVNTGKFLSPLSIGGGFRYQISKSHTDRQASSNAVSIMAGESLMLEKLTFQLEAPIYEKCVLVRLNMDLLKKENSSLRSHLNQRLKPEQWHPEMNKGLLICDGRSQNKKLNWTESYFILNQKIFNPQLINPNSQLGRPLFMAIRGERDFRRIMSFLNGRLTPPSSAQIQIHQQQSENSLLTPVFHLGSPSYPGQYNADQ